MYLFFIDMHYLPCDSLPNKFGWRILKQIRRPSAMEPKKPFESASYCCDVEPYGKAVEIISAARKSQVVKESSNTETENQSRKAS